jgi:hypothetical protein
VGDNRNGKFPSLVSYVRDMPSMAIDPSGIIYFPNLLVLNGIFFP